MGVFLLLPIKPVCLNMARRAEGSAGGRIGVATDDDGVGAGTGTGGGGGGG